MIAKIIVDQQDPMTQAGVPELFKRRTPGESAVPDDLSDLGKFFDFIRMLDGAGYPRAFLRFGRFRIEFSRASMYEGKIVADATITTTDSTT